MRKIIVIVLSLLLFIDAYAQTIIKMEQQRGVYLMPCKVNGLTLKFIFDTGASDVSMSITEALFMLKNDYLSESDFIGTEYYQIANGDIQEGTKVNIRQIEIGGHYLYNIQASIIHSLDAPLLLGQSALRQLGSFQFDYSTNTLKIFDGASNLANDNSTFGCISGDCFNGQGIYSFPTGGKYAGGFKEGKFCGQGTMTSPNGEKYVGEFKEDELNGQGTMTFPTGIKYVGEFRDGKLYGWGTCTLPNGQKYVGEFKEDEYNGQGTMTFPTGNKYVGEFRDGTLNGQGTFTYLNGNIYVGEFRDGKRNGWGTFYYRNGEKEVGVYRDDIYLGR